jgi:hypothetical protein
VRLVDDTRNRKYASLLDLKAKAEKILNLHRSEPSKSVPPRLRRPLDVWFPGNAHKEIWMIIAQIG